MGIIFFSNPLPGQCDIYIRISWSAGVGSAPTRRATMEVSATRTNTRMSGKFLFLFTTDPFLTVLEKMICQFFFSLDLNLRNKYVHARGEVEDSFRNYQSYDKNRKSLKNNIFKRQKIMKLRKIGTKFIQNHLK